MRPQSLAFLAAALGAASPAAFAQRLFDLPVFVPGSGYGEFRAQGDFDGDGDQDLVHMTGSSFAQYTGMTLFLNDGTGHFAPGSEVRFDPPPGVEVGQFDPAVGDFNGDGQLDVAVDHNATVLTGDGFEVFHGDGAGGFTGSAFVPLGTYVPTLIAGEIDGDAESELLVRFFDASSQGNYGWIDWNGAHYQLATSLALGPPLDPAGATIETVGDLDGDGDSDVAATSSNFTQVRLFPNVGGVLTYGASFPVPAPMHNINHRLRAGDLDGDGDTDLVHLKMYTTDPGPWIQAYEQSGGALVQHPAESVPTPVTDWFQPHQLRLGDWNGDGWLDLFANNFVLDVVRADGDWTFSEGFEAPSIGQAPGAGALDADGDGRLDYVSTNTILFGEQVFGPPPTAETGVGIAYPDGFQPLDSEGDGDLDLRGGNTGAWHVNDGTGAFVSPKPGIQNFFPVLPPGFFWSSSVAYADLDGDGRRDYLTQLWFNFTGGSGFVEMHVLLDDGLGAFAEGGVAAPALVKIGTAGAVPDALWETGDADGDGDQDLLVLDGYWRNNGSGFMEELVPAYTGRAHGAADVDGDGDLDLAGTRDLGTTTQVLLFAGTPGGFAPLVLGTLAGDALARFADLDLDGDLDLVAAAPTGAEIFLAENQGGVLLAQGPLAGTVENLRLLGIEDFDGDGLSDLLALRSEPPGPLGPVPVITAYRRTGPGLVYAALDEYLLPQADACDGFMDVDGDGDLDAFGAKLVRGARVEPPQGGVTRQYGTGFPGTAGVKPVLGAQGPATSTNPAAELRLVDAVGGGQAWIVFSLSEAALPGLPLPGMTLYVGGTPAILPHLPLSGPPGAAAQGELHLPLPKIPALFGLSVFHQAFVLDFGSALLWSATNGLEIQYGP